MNSISNNNQKNPPTTPHNHHRVGYLTPQVVVITAEVKATATAMEVAAQAVNIMVMAMAEEAKAIKAKAAVEEEVEAEVKEVVAATVDTVAAATAAMKDLPQAIWPTEAEVVVGGAMAVATAEAMVVAMEGKADGGTTEEGMEVDTATATDMAIDMVATGMVADMDTVAMDVAVILEMAVTLVH